MPVDAVFLSAVIGELRPYTEGAKVEKIYQPTRDEVILALRGQKGNCRLQLTANPAHARLQLTRTTRDNPANPPMFCMLLRKHLSGGRILSVTQPPMERVADLELETLDELGQRGKRHLILEAMGRHSNLIVTDGDGRIVDCLRRVDAEMSPERQMLPGLYYHLPPKQAGKCDPLAADEAALRALLEHAPREKALDALLLEHFAGLSPLICRELVFEVTGETDTRLHQMDEALRARWIANYLTRMEDIRAGRFTPVLLWQEGKRRDLSYRPIRQYGAAMQLQEMERFSDLLDEFYAGREREERLRQRGGDLIRAVTNLRDRTARKLENQRKELSAAQDRELLRRRGELITANLYRMTKGMRALEAQDFYSEDLAAVTVPLDPLLTPQQNAAKYFKRYQKAKTASQVLAQQIEKGEEDLRYLESELECIQRAEEEQDLIDIRRELEETGYLRAKKNGKKPEKKPKFRPLEFRSSAGLRISVGRNNTQNDQLTTKLAYKSDIWLHTQKIHGAHVILWCEGKEPDSESLLEAARLAAWFSKGREGSNVPVDYTPVRNVKKPSGAKPGMVIYNTYSTLYVTPDSSLEERLKSR